jgi:hypothetical protein
MPPVLHRRCRGRLTRIGDFHKHESQPAAPGVRPAFTFNPTFTVA